MVRPCPNVQTMRVRGRRPLVRQCVICQQERRGTPHAHSLLSRPPAAARAPAQCVRSSTYRAASAATRCAIAPHSALGACCSTNQAAQRGARPHCAGNIVRMAECGHACGPQIGAKFWEVIWCGPRALFLPLLPGTGCLLRRRPGWRESMADSCGAPRAAMSTASRPRARTRCGSATWLPSVAITLRRVCSQLRCHAGGCALVSNCGA